MSIKRIRVDHVKREVRIVLTCVDEYEAAVMYEDIAERLEKEHKVAISFGLAAYDGTKEP